jgi:molybdate transport system regulatory protein
MNTIPGTIVKVDSSENISLVDVDVGGDILTCVIIDTERTASYLRIGNDVKLVIKETEVALAKNLAGIVSIRNKMNGSVIDIEHGDILTKVRIRYKSALVTSVITTRSARALELKPGDAVTALVKSNEVSIMR